MIKRTADLVNEKKIEGIANIRDESDRNGMRIVYILKRDANVSLAMRADPATLNSLLFTYFTIDEPNDRIHDRSGRGSNHRSNGRFVNGRCGCADHQSDRCD